MALPTTGISTSLVKSTIGAATNDVGTLCAHPNINRWSKWKPISYQSLVGLTEDQLKSSNCGMIIPSFTTVGALVDYYNNNPSLKWEYNKPSGGANSPYRLGDFRGYEHSAIKFYNVLIPEFSVGIGGVTVEMPMTLSQGSMVWSDLYGIEPSSLYFGVRGSNGQTVVESENILTDNTGYVTLPTTSSIQVYAFLAKKSEVDPLQFTKYYALEGGTAYAQYSQSGVRAEMINTLYTSINSVMAQLTLTRVAAGITNLTGVSIQVRYGDKQPIDTIEMGEATYSFGDVSVSYGTPINLSRTFDNVLPDYSTRGGYVYLQCVSHNSLNEQFGLSVS